MSNPISSYLGLQADALPLREQRMKLIASNLANADTPGYRARDIDFNAALQAAAQARRSPPPREPGARSDHLPLAPGNELQGFHTVRLAAQPSLDGNTVDGDLENAVFAQAVLEYRASMSFVESKVRGMLTAITGQ